jgi:penicillin-binding protein 1C
MTFQGTVPVKRALQFSLNVPAIALLDRVGSSRLSSRLKQAGANLALPRDEAPGLAMGLGGVGVTLQDLALLYAGLPRLGTTKPLREIIDISDDGRDPLRLMDQVAAWQVGNVLLGVPPPENAARGRIAFKTGTSYGYRDAWSTARRCRAWSGASRRRRSCSTPSPARADSRSHSRSRRKAL